MEKTYNPKDFEDRLYPFSFAACKKNGKLIRINEVTHSVFYAPMYLADALGYFGDEDIEIEITNGGGADPCQPPDMRTRWVRT